ncbi:hypothetical protein AA0112_g602 [Alternaria arborescens]|nr:hypothetical protein AA0112_g602 [Alternaria arborescens]
MFGTRIVFALALVLALANIVATSGPTSIFIDQIDEYALLATCAELELSTIVRNMKYGCGDGGDGAFQSFTCFCYESSAKFSSMIGAHVATECPDDPSQNTTALEVFSSYCEIGGSKLAEITAATTSIPSITSLLSSTFASPASTPRSATSTPTTPVSSPQPTEATEQASTSKNNRTVAIAAGVAIPVVVLASAFVAFFLFRRHKNKKQHSRFNAYEVDASTVDASKAGTCHEVSDKGQIAAEMPNPDPQELDGESRGT